MLKSKLVIKAATAIFVIVTYLCPQGTIAQDRTKGDCSPIVKNITGDVSISCSFQGRTPVYKFSAIVDKKNARAAMGQLNKFLDKHNKEVFELDIRIDYFLEELAGCLKPNSIDDRWMRDNCKWSKYAYSSYKGNNIDGPGEVTLIHYYLDAGQTNFIIKGPSVGWQHGDIAIQGYFYSRNPGFAQGFVEILIFEISKRELLGSGRYNLDN